MIASLTKSMCWIMYDIYRIGNNLFVRPHESDKLAIKKYSALGTVSEKLHSVCQKTPFI